MQSQEYWASFWKGWLHEHNTDFRPFGAHIPWGGEQEENKTRQIESLQLWRSTEDQRGTRDRSAWKALLWLRCREGLSGLTELRPE